MNKRIRFARGIKSKLEGNTEVLAPGQPFYNKTTKQLYIGDGETTLNQIGVNSANTQHKGVAVKNAISAGMISGILCVPISGDIPEGQVMPYIDGDYSKGITINAGSGKEITLDSDTVISGDTTISGTATIGGSITINGTTTSKGRFIGNLTGVADSSKEINGVYIGSNKNILNNRLSLRASDKTISSNFYPVFYHSISAQVITYDTAITLSTALTTDAQSDGFDLPAFDSLISVSLNMGGTVVQSKFIEFGQSSQIVFTDIKQNLDNISFYRVVLDDVSFTRPNLTFSLTEVVGYVVDSDGFRLLGKKAIASPWTITFNIISPAYINTQDSSL